jgi:hypothetical protein
MQFKAYISFLEIYNDLGYDLLDPSQGTKSIEDLPKVCSHSIQFPFPISSLGIVGFIVRR